MVRVDEHGDGRVATRSGYVRIQGLQDDVALWPHARALVVPTAREPLSNEMAAALAPEPGREQLGGIAEWDLAFWVAAADQRAGMLVNLNDGGGSSARVDAASGTTEWGGPQGRALAKDLLAHVQVWFDAGRPAAEDHRLRFVPIDQSVLPADDAWVIDRVDHHQVIARGDR
jgi:hypothetical protein